jgi:bifunctional DNA-binding transcriptional regulator/antitoxin component of YhaV-PrlF toxin-antitoxin module
MTDTIISQLAQRGLVTLPKSWRDAYDLKAGDTLTLLDLGGVFVISPRRCEVDALASRVATALAESGETLENMLAALREARGGYETKNEPEE